MFVVDTNVLSDLRKVPSTDAGCRLRAWANSVNPADTFISAITVLEIEQGILILGRRDLTQANLMRRWFADAILAAFKDRILPVDTAVALRAAALHVPDPKPERDCLIAATALVHGMTVVTRNERDFAPMSVPIINPWSA